MIGRARTTLGASTETYTGVGLHSGADASVCLRPAPAGTGRVFRHRDSGQEIAARAENVSDTSRCTRLSAGSMEIQTVEHLLSALAGLGVDDAWIDVAGGELPAADGSAAPFAALVQAVGLREQPGGGGNALTLTEPVTVTGDGGSLLAALPADHFSATVVLDYPKHPYLGSQCAVWDAAVGDYAKDIAPARTFGFLSEIDWLRANGLGLGASRENAVVLGESGYETPLRFPNELARHKLLDLIGDLSLLGRPLAAQIVAVKPSHALNVRLAQHLARGLS